MGPRNRTANYGHSFTITRASIFPRLSPTASRPTDRLRLLPASPRIRHHAAPSPTRSQRAPAQASIPTAPRHSALTRPSTADGRRPTVEGATADRRQSAETPWTRRPSSRRRRTRRLSPRASVAARAGRTLHVAASRRSNPVSGYIDAGSPIKGTSRPHRCCDRNGQKFSAGVWSINFSAVCLQLSRRARRRGAESESAACRELRLGPTAQCGRHCLPRSSA